MQMERPVQKMDDSIHTPVALGEHSGNKDGTAAADDDKKMKKEQSLSSKSTSSPDLFGNNPSSNFLVMLGNLSEREQQEIKKAVERLGELFPHESYHLPVDFPRFQDDEVFLGSLLGRGTFCNVLDVVTIKPSLHRAGSASSVSREFCADRARDKSHNSRYALKRLQGHDERASSSWTSKVDLVVETRILSALVHPNIIKLRAIAHGNPLDQDYFLILDRLYLTLEERIELDQERLQEIQAWKVVPNLKQRAMLFQERIHHAFSLATAVKYMHKKRIIHRDLKPCNVGFDLVR